MCFANDVFGYTNAERREVPDAAYPPFDHIIGNLLCNFGRHCEYSDFGFDDFIPFDEFIGMIYRYFADTSMDYGLIHVEAGFYFQTVLFEPWICQERCPETPYSEKHGFVFWAKAKYLFECFNQRIELISYSGFAACIDIREIFRYLRGGNVDFFPIWVEDTCLVPLLFSSFYVSQIQRQSPQCWLGNDRLKRREYRTYQNG